jgi:hypothetical protein
MQKKIFKEYDRYQKLMEEHARLQQIQNHYLKAKYLDLLKYDCRDFIKTMTEDYISLLNFGFCIGISSDFKKRRLMSLIASLINLFIKRGNLSVLSKGNLIIKAEKFGIRK